MADGDFISGVTGQIPQGGRYLQVLLVDAKSATANGKWIEAKLFSSGVFDTTLGGSTSTVKLYGSNAAAKPADATDGRQIGSDITADGLVSVSLLPVWIKAKLSSYSGPGAVSVIALLRS